MRPSKASFEEVNKRYKVYRCLGAPAPGLAATRTKTRVTRTSAPAEGGLPAPADDPMAISDLRRFNDLILRAMPVGLVVIDRSYRMVTSNPTARRLLQLREHAGDDFLHAARGLPYNEMRASIDAAFRERVPATLPEVNLAAGGEERYVQVTISRVHPDDGVNDYAVISFVDVTDTVRGARRLQVSQDEQRLLVDELSSTNKRLGDMNKDLQDSNEELQAANEELLLAHEEMQATNEEFEATNEELQATNEELETNNEEMQSTNEELETTNEELSARSTELHDLTQTLTGERGRLARMVELAPFCMMILKGPGLRHRRLQPGRDAGARHRGDAGADVRGGVRRRRRPHRRRPRRLPQRRPLDEPAAPRRAAPGRRRRRRTRTSASSRCRPSSTGTTDGVVLYAEDLSALSGGLRPCAQAADLGDQSPKPRTA